MKTETTDPTQTDENATVGGNTTVDENTGAEKTAQTTDSTEPATVTESGPTTDETSADSASTDSSSGTPSGKARVVKKRRGTPRRKSQARNDRGKAPAGATKTTGSGASRVVVALLSVVTVAALALAIVFGLLLKNRVDTDNAGQEALRTAKDYAVALTSIDTANLDRDFGRVLDGATGEFKDMYANSSSQLRQLLVDNQATGKGTVVDAGIKSQTENRVEVLLFVDQTVTNTASPDPRIDRSRIVMTMEKIDGRWLASKVELP